MMNARNADPCDNDHAQSRWFAACNNIQCFIENYAALNPHNCCKTQYFYKCFRHLWKLTYLVFTLIASIYDCRNICYRVDYGTDSVRS